MAKLYVGKGKGRQGFAEYVIPAAWLRRFVRKGRMRVATEEEAARYALAETKRPVRLIDLPVLPHPAPMPEEESETEITEDDEGDEVLAELVDPSELPPPQPKGDSFELPNPTEATQLTPAVSNTVGGAVSMADFLADIQYTQEVLGFIRDTTGIDFTKADEAKTEGKDDQEDDAP